MNAFIKKLLLVFVLVSLVKFLLSLFVPTIMIYSDAYIYAKMARSFFYHGAFLLHGNPLNFYPPLYPILLSISYVFRDMRIVYAFMKLINSFVSSLVIFPAWLLAKEFFSKKKSLIIAFLCLITPFSFSFAPYLMAENLFFPLFLFSFYFIYKSFVDKRLLWDALAGISMALLYLTKVHGISLVFVVIMAFIVSLIRREFFQVKKKSIMALSFILVYAGWAIRNVLLFGFSIPNLLGFGGYSAEVVFVTNQHFSFPGFCVWVILYLGLLILGSGIVFPALFVGVLNKVNFKDNKRFFFILLLFFLLFVSLVIAANHNSTAFRHVFSWMPGRPLGRYVDFLIPLIITGGFLGISNSVVSKTNSRGSNIDHRRFKKRIICLFAPVLLFSSFLVMFPLLPLNNLSLSWIGVINVVLNFVFLRRVALGGVYFSLGITIFFALLFFALLIVAVKFLDKITFKKAFVFLLLFFVMINGINSVLTIYNSNFYWGRGEQNQIGAWFNEHDKGFSHVLFDEDDCTIQLTKREQEGICDELHASTLMGFWMNDELRIGNVGNADNFDYLVSKKNLNYKVLKQTSKGIYLYSVKDKVI
ncbi:MAG: glycosyltransferase family 39 protein [Nanoarchaeota archaeon]|nr:glycosyltransferase family 39 protein [Nanoarchaeota archaeon]